MLFSDLPLDHRILKNLNLKGFDQATEIQAQAIPKGLLGRDLLASSKTGSGKTLAFLIPALDRVLKSKALSKKDPRVLILAPTRELAKQVFMQLKWLTQKLPVAQALVLGGENFNDQVKQLRRNPEFVVGTAGRVADHLTDKSLFLNGLELLVLDEADRMLDLGFAAQLKLINGAADHRKRQTMMFSATLDNAEIHFLTQQILNAPSKITIGSETQAHQDIQQSFVLADGLAHKETLLDTLLESDKREQVIVFTATRDDAERLANKLNEQGYSAAGLSGKLNQGQRNNIMSAFSNGQHQILVTTDVASRGLDLLKVGLVINFDLPKFAEEYIHRVGRTGRAGNKGKAISFVSRKDWKSFESIKNLLDQKCEFTEIDGLQAEFKGVTSRRPQTAKKQKSDKKPSQGANNNTKQNASKRIKTMQGQDVGSAPMKRKKVRE